MDTVLEPEIWISTDQPTTSEIATNITTEKASECFIDDPGDLDDLFNFNETITQKQPVRKIKKDSTNFKKFKKPKNLKSKKAQKLKQSNLNTWFSRNKPSDLNTESSILSPVLMACRRPSLGFSAQSIFCASPKIDALEGVYGKDLFYRKRSLDQLDFLVKTGAMCFYYLKKQGYLQNTEEICDRINKFIYDEIKENLMLQNTVETLMHTVLDIEEKGLLHDCVSLVVGLLNLTTKKSGFQKIAEDLKKTKWDSLPSDYQRFTTENITGVIKTTTIDGVF